MKLIRRVNRIEPKRCFVIGQYIRKYKVEKRYLPELTKKEFNQKLKTAKKYVLKLPERRLDKIISDEYKKRLRLYNKMDWYIGEVSIEEIGVWRWAGGLPLTWTQRSLKETADKTKKGLVKNDKKIRARSKRAIPQIIKQKPILLKEKYLYPIIVPPASTTGRRALPKMRGDIDDGCMRAIAFAVSGTKRFRAYIGKFHKEI